jgi:outer membrane protein assembly factor BamB
MGRSVVTLILVMCLQAVSLYAADWPQFRGPNRDGKSPETGLMKRWPEAGPSLVRTISGVGGGFSSAVIAEERIFITGKIGDDLKIFCFDGSGRKIWKTTHAPAFSEANAPHSPYPAARATPTIDGDMVYLLGGLGRLTAYRISDGEPVWSVDVVSEQDTNRLNLLRMQSRLAIAPGNRAWQSRLAIASSIFSRVVEYRVPICWPT